MKKCISVFMAILFMMSAFMINAGAEKNTPIVIHIKDDISGLTCNDGDKLFDILSDNVEIDKDGILISDKSGDIYFDRLKPGRTYSVYYRVVMKDGCDFPEEINSESLQIISDPGCTVYWSGKTTGSDTEGNPRYSITIFAGIQVKGNFFQRFFGAIADFFLKLSAWAPY